VLSSISNFEPATTAPVPKRRPAPSLTSACEVDRGLPRHARSAGPADRVPREMGRAWIIALIGTLAILAALEFNCRRHGLRPMVHDDQQLWGLARDSMHRDDPDQIALVGTSRGHNDLDPKVFSHEMGGAPVAQLAIEGATGLLVLDELSRDEHFRGLLVFDLVPWGVFGDMTHQDATERTFVESHLHVSWVTPIETRIRIALQLAFAFGQMSLRDFVQDRFTHRPPNWSQPYIIEPDRSAGVHWSLATPDQLKWPQHYAIASTPGVPPTLRQENLQALESMIERIQARGGRVVLVSLPSTGIVGEVEHARWPRDRFWDVLAAQTKAVTFNWMDDPRLSKFNCPDGSHLDMRDQAEFTRLVVEDLREKLRTRQLNP